MDSDRHARLVELFDRACALPSAERSAWLGSVCDDPDLRAEVLELLAHDDSEGFLTSDHEPGARFRQAAAPTSFPTHIADFELHEEIGRGGMGVVFRATQRRPAREVALKVLVQGGLSADARKRFELEAEALGRLQHPGIAQIHAAGTHRSDDGCELPYLAMELVRGEPLGAWCARHRPDRRTRLELLIALCDAMQHAHQRGLIHRDLKPANILVDDAGRPKVLDFGIARLVEDEPAATLHTRTGQVLGTLAYMSPEQAEGSVGSADQRTDVHALGVIGFELLTGELPYAVAGQSVTRALQVLAAAEPRALSALDRSLRGDLDTIFRMALERDPARRYASADAFGADLRRFLAHEVINARPPSAVDQLRKFARRNRATVAGSALALVALVAGTALSLAWALRAEDAAARERIAAARAREATLAAQRNLAVAEDEAARANFVSDFTQRLFLAAAPEIALGREMSARDIVEQGKELALLLPDDQQLMRSQICRFLGVVLLNMGDHRAAESLLTQALADLRAGIEGDDERLVEALFTAGRLGFETGRPELAREQLQASLDMHRRLGGGDDHRVARCLEGLGQLERLADRLDAALGLFGEAVAIWERESAADPALLDDYSRVLMNRASTLSLAGRLEEADAEAQSALEVAERIGAVALAASHATNLGSLRIRQRRVAEAEVLFRRALELGERHLGAGNPRLLPRLVNLASLCGMTGRLDEAEPLLARAVRLCEGRDISHDEDAASALVAYGALLSERGRFDAALGHWRRAAEIQEALGGPMARPLAATLENMARAEARLGNREVADRLLARVRAIRSQ